MTALHTYITLHNDLYLCYFFLVVESHAEILFRANHKKCEEFPRLPFSLIHRCVKGKTQCILLNWFMCFHCSIQKSQDPPLLVLFLLIYSAPLLPLFKCNTHFNPPLQFIHSMWLHEWQMVELLFSFILIIVISKAAGFLF